MDAEAWDRRYEGTELLWSAQPNRFLVAEAQALPPGRALDLACGEGRNAVWLAELGWKVTGVDFSPVAIGKAGQLAAARGVAGEFEVADLLAYEPAGQAFDLVIVFYLQVLAAVRNAILRRAAAAVAPGGTFLLVAHGRSNLEEGYGGPRDPDVLYTPRMWSRTSTGSRSNGPSRCCGPSRRLRASASRSTPWCAPGACLTNRGTGKTFLRATRLRARP